MMLNSVCGQGGLKLAEHLATQGNAEIPCNEQSLAPTWSREDGDMLGVEVAGRHVCQ